MGEIGSFSSRAEPFPSLIPSPSSGATDTLPLSAAALGGHPHLSQRIRAVTAAVGPLKVVKVFSIFFFFFTSKDMLLLQIKF